MRCGQPGSRAKEGRPKNGNDAVPYRCRALRATTGGTKSGERCWSREIKQTGQTARSMRVERPAKQKQRVRLRERRCFWQE